MHRNFEQRKPEWTVTDDQERVLERDNGRDSGRKCVVVDRLDAVPKQEEKKKKQLRNKMQPRRNCQKRSKWRFPRNLLI